MGGKAADDASGAGALKLMAPHINMLVQMAQNLKDDGNDSFIDSVLSHSLAEEEADDASTAKRPSRAGPSGKHSPSSARQGSSSGASGKSAGGRAGVGPPGSGMKGETETERAGSGPSEAAGRLMADRVDGSVSTDSTADANGVSAKPSGAPANARGSPSSVRGDGVAAGGEQSTRRATTFASKALMDQRMGQGDAVVENGSAAPSADASAASVLDRASRNQLSTVVNDQEKMGKLVSFGHVSSERERAAHEEKARRTPKKVREREALKRSSLRS